MSGIKAQARFWNGDVPHVCQICDQEIVGVFVDGKTQWDCWAFMCLDCWETHGEGLGTGKGQMYGRQADNRWLKLETQTGIDTTIAALREQLLAGLAIRNEVDRVFGKK